MNFKCAVQRIFTIEHTHRTNALIRRQNTASALEIYLMLPPITTLLTTPTLKRQNCLDF